MTELLPGIRWDEPVIQPTDDPAWFAECARLFGIVPRSQRYIASVHWVRRFSLDANRVQFRDVSPRLAALTGLVTSQENSCRYCVGVAHAQLRLIGFSEKFLQQLYQDAQVAGIDQTERALMRFCRNLARSNPRPARAERESLEQMGCSPGLIVDIAANVAMLCFHNRVATFLAVPPERELEAMPDSFVSRLSLRLSGMFSKSGMKPLEFRPPAEVHGPFSPLIALVAGSAAGAPLWDCIAAAFASDILPARAKAWMFAVVARSLGCNLCAAAAKEMLVEEGVAPEEIERVLTTLRSPNLSEMESLLLPWARETVHYRTETMQARTRELAQKVDSRVLVEAIGIAALANGCARLGMLNQ